MGCPRCRRAAGRGQLAACRFLEDGRVGEANEGCGAAPTPDRAWVPMGQQLGLPAAARATKEEVLGSGGGGRGGAIHSRWGRWLAGAGVESGEGNVVAQQP
ncbi:uncharacterized protein K460DRAFT_352111 [Cucurbitaria berberidis CBS 394.84]|uniref:Uncharacterized protein n=1 Tax=Cucurbitaria berberidis CBS 394.84 TaxID=1168544 RepID=A0A9P4GK52_9PLEO|nr:uncharacterized protein K460DRAFT_352111 [Cucurbitaria berberidis CBS 394.84]KAF1846914.1 hypothetical protein K460DRAFT_352111 [Cucurbitaria berberidis CBS 394.84]